MHYMLTKNSKNWKTNLMRLAFVIISGMPTSLAVSVQIFRTKNMIVATTYSKKGENKPKDVTERRLSLPG